MISNFLFHRVNPQRDKLWDPMDVKLFDRCIKYITQKFEVVQLEQLVGADAIKKQNGKLATIVFDDGYKDNIEYAAPILDKYKCRASFYVVTDCIDNNIPTWTYNLEYRFQYTNKSKIDLSFDFLPVELRVSELTNKQARTEYVKRLKPALKKITHGQRNSVLDRVATAFNDVELPKIMMNWKEVGELKNAGHYIGSHTVTHCMLGTMTGESEIKNELAQSGKIIEKQLGYFPKTISYPVGSYNTTTIQLSKEAGYTIGLAVKQAKYNPATDSVFEIPRIELYNEPWWKTQMRITHSLEKIKTIIRFR